MADYWPSANGNWSTLSNWLTAVGQTAGVLPGSADDVYANGRTVTVDIDPFVNSVRTTVGPGGTGGGLFRLSDNVSLTALLIVPGTNTCINYNSSLFATVVGFLIGTNDGNIVGISNTSSGTLFFYGNAEGGSFGNGYGFNNSSTGTITIYGEVSGGRGGSVSAYGVYNASTGTINIIGNVYSRVSAGCWNNNIGTINITGQAICAGSASCGANQSGGTINLVGNSLGGPSANGLVNSSTGVINVTGNVIGGTGSTTYGVNNNTATGSVYVYGKAIASNTAAGANNASSGLLYCTSVVGNDFGLGSVGIAASVPGLINAQNGRAYVEQVEFGVRGATPITGPVYILPSNRNTLTGYTTALGQTVTFYNSLSVDGLLPPASSVRLGEVYNVGNSVGTMAVPAPESVEFGVPIDNTVGTAALTPQNVWGYARLSATETGSIGDRLRNAATAQSVGSQIASFNL
jgi:hypothetical protein